MLAALHLVCQLGFLPFGKLSHPRLLQGDADGEGILERRAGRASKQCRGAGEGCEAGSGALLPRDRTQRPAEGSVQDARLRQTVSWMRLYAFIVAVLLSRRSAAPVPRAGTRHMC